MGVTEQSQFENLEEGTSGQLPTGHRNGTNTVISRHIQRVTPENSSVEVHGKKILSKVWPWMNIFPLLWCANKISIDPFFLYALVINYDKNCVEEDKKLMTVEGHLRPFSIFIICGSFVSLALNWVYVVDSVAGAADDSYMA
ncbi:hypothetical protein Q3G72_012404 [Acer saccharum]|nr:hypothetical protein Q3G72_012404 [Acer saccharum]